MSSLTAAVRRWGSSVFKVGHTMWKDKYIEEGGEKRELTGADDWVHMC